MSGKLLVTPTEAAALLSVSRAQVYKMIQRGELPSIKVGSLTRVPVDSLRI